MDNEALGTEEESESLDIISLLAKKNEEEGEEYDEIDEHEEDDIPDDPEKLKELLRREREIKRKRNYSLKKAKQTNHRLLEESDAYRERLDKLEAMMNGIQSGKGAEDLGDEIQQWQDRVADDPAQAIEYANWKQSMLEEKIANYLGVKFNEFEQKFGALKTATDPEYVKYRSQVEALRSNPKFASLDDDTALAIVKELSEAKIKKPRGDIGGNRIAKTTKSDFKLSDEERAKMGF